MVAPAGFVGLVTAVRDGLAILDSNPAAVSGTSGLRTGTAVTGNPVTLAGGGTHVGDPVTVTAAPGVLREGNRIVLTGFGASAGLVNFGTVQPAAGGTWRLRPSVATPPDDAVVVLIHR